MRIQESLSSSPVNLQNVFPAMDSLGTQCFLFWISHAASCISFWCRLQELVAGLLVSEKQKPDTWTGCPTGGMQGWGLVHHEGHALMQMWVVQKLSHMESWDREQSGHLGWPESLWAMRWWQKAWMYVGSTCYRPKQLCLIAAARKQARI